MSPASGGMLSIRHATPDDAAGIVSMIRELAAYERLLDHVLISEADVLRDGFGERPAFECLLAEIDGEAVGFALFFQTYSTFRGRSGIFVEDLFVRESVRRSGAGRALMARLAALTLERQGARLELRALHWNPARTFYERLGMRHIDGWLSYRLEGAGLERLADA